MQRTMGLSTDLAKVTFAIRQARLEMLKDTPGCENRKAPGREVPDNYRDILALQDGCSEMLLMFEEWDIFFKAFKDRFDCELAENIGDQLIDGFDATLHDTPIGYAIDKLKNTSLAA